MFIALLPICFVILWLIFYLKKNSGDVRLAFLKALICIYLLILFNTELLSLFNVLNKSYTIVVWFVEIFVLSIYLYVYLNRSSAETLKAGLRKVFDQFKKLMTKHTGEFVLISAIYILLFVVALMSAPNTADSLTYHMARVANWIQWQSVDYYPTATLRQLYLGPLSEYGIMQTILLSGGDLFANLIQFSCLVGSGVVVSLLVRECSGNLSTQILATILTATIPMATLQATSTQTDLVVAFFFSAFLLFYLRFYKSGEGSELIFSGVTLGLGFLTKGTAYIFCASAAIVILLAVIAAKKPAQSKLRFVKQSLLILLLGLSINLIQYHRSYSLFGSPISTGEDSLVIKYPNPQTIVTNLAKNYVVHLPNIFYPNAVFLNSSIKNVFGDELNKPGINFMESKFGFYYSDHEDKAGNLIHLLFLTICLGAVFLNYNRSSKVSLYLAGVTLVSFLLFASLLKWQPWVTRLQLPIFIIGCAVIALGISKLPSRLTSAFLMLMLAGFTNTLLMGEPRSMLSVAENINSKKTRFEQLFANGATIKDSYYEVADYIKQKDLNELGLMMEVDYTKYYAGDWEYPIWYHLKGDYSSKPIIRHVGIKNISNTLIENHQMPEWIISAGNENTINGVDYEEVLSRAPIRVLKRKKIE